VGWRPPLGSAPDLEGGRTGSSEGAGRIVQEGCCLVGKGAQVNSAGPGLDPKFFLKFHYVKRRFSITSKCWQMHEVLNLDEIKN
jgi:hypothetical protein